MVVLDEVDSTANNGQLLNCESEWLLDRASEWLLLDSGWLPGNGLLNSADGFLAWVVVVVVHR